MEWSDRRACNDGNGEAVVCVATTTESLCGNNVGAEMDLFIKQWFDVTESGNNGGTQSDLCIEKWLGVVGLQ